MPDEELENKTWSKVRGLPLSLLLFNMVPEVLAKKTKKKKRKKKKKERKKEKGLGERHTDCEERCVFLCRYMIVYV